MRTVIAADQVPLLRAWREGLRVVVADRNIRGVLLTAASSSVAQGIFVVSFVLFVTRVLHGDGAQIGLLRGVQAIGGIIGGLLIGMLGTRVGARRLVVVGASSLGLLNLVIWNAPLITVAQGLYVGLFIAAGVPVVAYSSGLFTLMQQQVDDCRLGRVSGIFLTVQGTFQALGMLLAGALGDTVDIVVLLDAQACLLLAAAVLAGRRMAT